MAHGKKHRKKAAEIIFEREQGNIEGRLLRRPFLSDPAFAAASPAQQKQLKRFQSKGIKRPKVAAFQQLLTDQFNRIQSRGAGSSTLLGVTSPSRRSVGRRDKRQLRTSRPTLLGGRRRAR